MIRDITNLKPAPFTKLVCTFFISIAFCAPCIQAESNQKAGSERIVTYKKVEVFLTDWCPYCVKLEKFLNAHQIRYLRLNIEKDSRAKRMYEQLGGGGVPVVRIDSKTIIRGFEPSVLYQELKSR